MVHLLHLVPHHYTTPEEVLDEILESSQTIKAWNGVMAATG
jgi:hypothetical protein